MCPGARTSSFVGDPACREWPNGERQKIARTLVGVRSDLGVDITGPAVDTGRRRERSRGKSLPDRQVAAAYAPRGGVDGQRVAVRTRNTQVAPVDRGGRRQPAGHQDYRYRGGIGDGETTACHTHGSPGTRRRPSPTSPDTWLAQASVVAAWPATELAARYVTKIAGGAQKDRPAGGPVLRARAVGA
jgi:hypothetical protein